MRHINKGVTLLETHLQKKEYSQYWLSSAATNTYVPTFNAKTIVAYSLK